MRKDYLRQRKRPKAKIIFDYDYRRLVDLARNHHVRLHVPCAFKDRDGNRQFEDNALTHRNIGHARGLKQRDLAREDR